MQKLNKVAAISLIFWLMKIVATTLGETLGDFFSMTLKMGYLAALGITTAFFLLVLIIQLKVNRYIPALFWLVIIATTTLGTEVSDFIDRSLHLGYTWGSVLLTAGLVVTLLLWYQKYRSLRVYPISETNKELYFWIAVLFSNSLGTAFGDYLGDVAGLSYGAGALVTAGIILLVLALHYFTKINDVILFWIAFVFTRPFGATFGDLLTKPVAKGGLDLGTLWASAVSIIVMVVLVIISHKKHKRETVVS